MLQFGHTVPVYHSGLKITANGIENHRRHLCLRNSHTPAKPCTPVCTNKARIMLSLLWLFDQLVYIIFWIIIIMVVMSWLIAFNVLNNSNNIVRQINYTLHRLTEPLLAPIRRFLPDLGGIDLSPLVLLLGLMFLQRLLHEYLV